MVDRSRVLTKICVRCRHKFKTARFTSYCSLCRTEIQSEQKVRTERTIPKHGFWQKGRLS